MSCKNEIWCIVFDESSMLIFLNGNKILDEATIVAQNEKGRFVEAGNKVLLDESKYHTTIKPLISGQVLDFGATVYYLKTMFGNRLNKKRRIQSLTALVPIELGIIEERAIKEALEEISKNVHLRVSSDVNNVKEIGSTCFVEKSPKTIANIIADELVANARMIALALFIAAIYIGIFLVYHHTDRKPVAETEWGQSCYDNTNAIEETYNLDWQRIYYDNWVRKSTDELNKFKIKEHGYDEELRFVAWRNTQQFDDSILLKSALAEVEYNENLMKDEENNIRMSQARNDLLLHLKYSIVIALCLTIIGRYFIKLAKWVSYNKTK